MANNSRTYLIEIALFTLNKNWIEKHKTQTLNIQSAFLFGEFWLDLIFFEYCEH